jgi:hypothetical protein
MVRTYMVTLWQRNFKMKWASVSYNNKHSTYNTRRYVQLISRYILYTRHFDMFLEVEQESK